jgi:hypothetical protein
VRCLPVLAVLAAFALSLGAVACGGSDAPRASSASDTPEPAIASEWRARCGACHVKVEPHSRDRAQLTQALGRHRSRARLKEEQWAALIDFLAR